MSVSKDLVKILKESDKKGAEPYDTEATVKRVDGSTAWVHIPGGVDETPALMAVNAKEGDTVRVNVAGGNAYITGNVDNPPTDDTYAKRAERQAIRATQAADAATEKAEIAHQAADRAVEDSSRAKTAATQATEDASTAKEAATQAQSDADQANTILGQMQEAAEDAGTTLTQIYADAEEAKETTEEINAYAETAGKTVTQILNDGETAGQAAQEAIDSAQVAHVYANSALDQLSVVENVVGVLELLQNNGDYQITQDEEVQGGKWYFSRSGTSPDFVYSVVNNPSSVYHLSEDTSVESGKTYYTRSGSGTEEAPYVYTEVDSPSGSPVTQGWYEKYYELVGIDESIQNYVTSQLVVDDQGLWLKRPDSTGIQTKVLLSSTAGVVMYGANGRVVGKYGETAQIGGSAGFHIDIGVWYKLTEDVSIDPNKTYYTRTGTTSDYVYTEVANPDVSEISTYYEQMPPEIGFYQAENKVAYINNNQLYITQSVVLQQMDLGMIYDGITGFGQWSWKVHKNGDDPPKNNLNLKWVG